jgi:hypothetical protein
MRKWVLIIAAVALVLPTVSAQEDIEISGLIDIGFVHNFNDPPRPSSSHSCTDGTRGLGPVTQNKEDSFTPTLVQLVVSKEAEPVGFEIKLDFFSTATALNAQPTVGTTADDIEIQAANIIYAMDVGNGLTLVAGKMDTVVGHDKVESTKNANLTHGLIYGVLPKTHVGVRGLYPLMDNVTVALGVNNGSDQDADDTHGKSLEAMVSYLPLEELAIDVAVLYGPENAGDEANKAFALSVVTTYDVTEEASVFGELAYVAGEATTGTEDTKVVGIGVGGTYDITDVYSAAIRYEYLETDMSGSTEYQWEITVTGAAQLTEDLVLRLEFRYDKSTNESGFQDDSDAGYDDAQAVLGAQLLYTF